MLGRATQFKAYKNDALRATVVDIQLGTDRRVLMVNVGADGFPALEDISSQISRVAGAGMFARTAGVSVDFTGFAIDGTVTVNRVVDGTARQLTLGQQVTRERAVAAAGASQ